MSDFSKKGQKAELSERFGQIRTSISQNGGPKPAKSVKPMTERTMTTKTVILKEGVGICELRPIDGGEDLDQARVLGGTIGRKGDVLRKPADLTWAEAVQEIAPGRTALSPFDLEMVQDSITHHSFIPGGGLKELSALYEEVASQGE